MDASQAAVRSMLGQLETGVHVQMTDDTKVLVAREIRQSSMGDANG